MPVTIPTVKEIRDRMLADFGQPQSPVSPFLPRSFTDVLVTVVAGAIYPAYKFGQRIARNLHPATAEGDQLDVFALDLDDFERQQGQSYRGKAEVLGIDDAVVPVGTRATSKNGAQYLVVNEGRVTGGQAFVKIEAIEKGLKANLPLGATLRLDTRAPGIDASATITEVLRDGLEEESFEAFRPRLMERRLARPLGAAAQDFVQGARTVAGVTRVFPYEVSLNTVRVYFLRDNDPVSRIPNDAEVEEVRQALNAPMRRQAGCFIEAAAPTERVFEVVLDPSSVVDRQALEKGLSDYFLGRSMFVNEILSPRGINQILLPDINRIVLRFANASATAFRAEPSGQEFQKFELGLGEVARFGGLVPP